LGPEGEAIEHKVVDATSIDATLAETESGLWDWDLEILDRWLVEQRSPTLAVGSFRLTSYRSDAATISLVAAIGIPLGQETDRLIGDVVAEIGQGGRSIDRCSSFIPR
jgi:hypothetical protein